MNGKKYEVGVTLLLLALFLLVTHAHGHKSGGYYHGGSMSDVRSDWMKWLPNDWLISELSIPGTHDTMTYKGVDIQNVYTMQTQTLSLNTQLQAGIRALDIRLVRNGDDFDIHHGNDYLESNFTDVLNVVKQFLQDHPGETILMRLKRERPEGEDDTDELGEFFSTLDSIIIKYLDLFWLPNDEDGGNGVPKWDLTIEVPNLGDVRSKIVIFDGMPLQESRWRNAELYGLPFEGSSKYFLIQDNFKLNCKQLCELNLYNKWKSIKELFSTCREESPNKICINHLSGNGDIYAPPWFIASGHILPLTESPRQWTFRTDPLFSDFEDFPRLNCVTVFWVRVCSVFFEGTNELTYKYIKTLAEQDIERLGIIMMDFPGHGLIDKIIGFNTGHWSKLVCANGPYDEGEGLQINFEGSPSDPSLSLQYKWEWNSCDFDDEGVCIPGTEWSYTTGWSYNPNVDYTWYDDFSGTATIWVTDGDVTHTDETQVTVYNVAPSTIIDLISQTNVPFLLPLAVTNFNGSFTDPGSPDTHAGLWDFGEGSDWEPGDLVEENDPPNSTGNVSGSHIYSEPGTYTVSLTVIDDDGGEGSDTQTIKVLTAKEAAQAISDFIQNCPENVFKNNPRQRKNAFSNKLKALIDMLNAGEYREGIEKLENDIRDKTDGVKNDWITDAGTQAQICPMINALVAYLQNLL